MTTSDFLHMHPVFSLETASQWLAGNAQRRIQRAVAAGRARAIRRGLYMSVPPRPSPAPVQPDRYLVLAELRSDAVVAGHSALEMLGMAHSAWQVCAAYTTGRRSVFTIGGLEYRLVTPTARLGRADALERGLVSTLRGHRVVRHLGHERCLTDGLDRPWLFGGVVEVVRSLDGVQMLDLDLLERLLAAFDRRTLYGAVGWFLERHAQQLFVPEGLLTRFEAGRPRSPHYLDRRVGNAVLSRRWNVLVPRELAVPEQPDA